MYQALYRKWRPKTFDNVVGQAHVSETLKQQVSSGRLSHAYLFVGTRGTGKTTCAKILAKAVNCLKPQNGNPCNTCASCLGIDNGSILDVLELDAASNNGVDNVRALREEAIFTPADVKKRVYIIDEVHMLSTQAFNALLKILEEPPEHLMFILATTEIHKVPATILSRCQRYMFKRIPAGDIAKRLLDIATREGINLTDDAAALLSRLADGSLRDALSLLDQCAAENDVNKNHVLTALGLTDGSETTRLFAALAEGDIPEALSRLDMLYADGKVMGAVLEELLRLVRDTLVMVLMPKGGCGLLSGGFDEKTLSGFAKCIPEERLLYMMEQLRQALLDVSKGTNGKLAAEICLIRLAGICQETDAAASKITYAKPVKKTNVSVEKPDPLAAVVADEVTAAEKPSQEASGLEKHEAEKLPALEEIVQDTQIAELTKSTASIHSTLPEALWPAVLEYIKPKIDKPAYSFLSDMANTSADLNGDTLTVKIKNAFYMQVIDNPTVTKALKEAAVNLLGNPTAVQITQDKDEEPETTDKIDELRQYSNVKFK